VLAGRLPGQQIDESRRCRQIDNQRGGRRLPRATAAA
jgi:hypothetical protein